MSFGGATSKRVFQAEIWLAAPFFVASLDVLLNYFISHHLISFRVSIFTALALGAVILKFGFKVLRIGDQWIFALAMLCLSLLMGVAWASDITSARIVEIPGILVYFFCGYACFRWVKNVRLIQSMFLVLSLLYIPICIIALIKLWPAIFPLTEGLWSQEGTLRTRPEVMTDQNFQAFYFLPAVVGFAMPSSLLRSTLFGVLIVGAAYTLAQLQTRSGSLVLGAVLFLGLVSALRNRSMGRNKVLIIPVVAVVLIMVSLPYIVEYASLLIYRFTDMDYSTAMGRVRSATYLFDKVLNPAWWLPRGNNEFLAEYGVLPHSNFTAFFLEGGLIGLAAALALIAVPAFRLAARVAKGGLDPIAVAVGCAGLGVLALQLSLNVATHTQVWLWAGSVIGVLERIRSSRKAARVPVQNRARLA